MDRKWAKKHQETFHQKAYIDANKHIKRCSTSLTIKKMQIKIMMRYHYTLIRIAKIQITDNINIKKGYGETGLLIHCYWEWKIWVLFWAVWQFLMKLNVPIIRQSEKFPSFCSAGDLCLHNTLYMLYSCFIHNCQNLEATRWPLVS